jgi:SPOR domain
MSFFNKFILIALFFSYFSYSQKNVTVYQDPKFEKLLSEKKKLNISANNADRYRIQIYNGDTETAKTTLAKFKKENENYDAVIVFNTPTYKVLVGGFKTRIEAERNLKIIAKQYKNALLIKPVK